MTTETIGVRVTVHAPRDEREDAVVSLVAADDVSLVDLMAIITGHGFDIQTHWFVVPDKGEWFLVDLNRCSGGLDGLYLLNGVRGETEAVEDVRAWRRHCWDELDALEAARRTETTDA